jgi:cell division septation protein DedD
MSSFLDPAISSLLYRHDCVIVPEFGGFVANKIPASLNSRLNLIVPPSKQITFNRNLTHNDGLLINRISRDLGLNFEEAKAQLDKEVDRILRDLRAGKRVPFDKVGLIYMSADHNWHFVADDSVNFNTDSYGFESLYLPDPIVRETVVVPIAAAQQAQPQVSKPTRRRRFAAAAVAIPIIALVGLYSYGKINNNSGLNLANFNPFSQKELPSDFQPRIEEEAIVFDYPDNNNPLDDLVNESSSEVVNYSFVNSAADPNGITVRVIEKTDATEEVDAAKVSAAELYFIVGGAFREKTNADNMVDRLIEKGYDASIFGMRGDLHLVCYGSYVSKKAAKKALKEVRQSDSKSAWLKKHRS